MRRSLAASFMVSAALYLGGCLGFPALEIRDSTYDQSPAGKFAWAVWSFDEQVVSGAAVQWFLEKCPPGGTGEARECAIRMGMTCEAGPAVDCFYEAQHASRRVDRHGLPGSREWRTGRFRFAVTGTATGEGIQATSSSEPVSPAQALADGVPPPAERSGRGAGFAAHSQQEPRMTDPERNTPDAPSETLDEQVDQVEDDVEAMDRPGRAIPLPDESGEDDEGVGEITGIVP